MPVPMKHRLILANVDRVEGKVILTGSTQYNNQADNDIIVWLSRASDAIIETALFLDSVCTR